MYSVNLSIWKKDDCVNYFRNNSSQLSNTFENSKYETGVQLNNVTSKKADSNIAIYEKTGKMY